MSVGRVTTTLQRSLWRPMMVLLGVAYLWQLFLYLRSGSLTPGAVAISAWFPLVVIPIWAVWSTIRLMESAEGDGGGRVILARLGMTLLQVLAFTLLVGLGAFILFRAVLGVAGLLELLPIPALDWFLGLLLRGYLVGLVLVLLLAAITQFSYLFSRLVSSFRWLLGTWVYLLTAWVGLRIIPLVGAWLKWLPDFVIDEVYAVGDLDLFEFRPVLLESGPFVATLIYLVAVVIASSFLMAKLQSKELHDGTVVDGTPVETGGGI